MKIQVLGTGCAKCDKLYKHAVEAVESAGVDAEVEKVTDIAAIMAAGVMTTPALVVDGEVKIVGKAPSADEIVTLIS